MEKQSKQLSIIEKLKGYSGRLIGGIVAFGVVLSYFGGIAGALSALDEFSTRFRKLEKIGTTQKDVGHQVELTCSSFLLQGTVTDTSGGVTNAWFEWGISADHLYETPSAIFATPSDYSYPLTGLAENTTYLYRSVAVNAVGKASGNFYSFTTTSC